MVALIILVVLLVIGLCFIILQWAKSKAASLVLLFLAQSLLIKNLHPDRRPEYIIKKAEESSDAVVWVVRPLVMWYISNRGINIATRFLQYLVNDIRSDKKIEIAP